MYCRPNRACGFRGAPWIYLTSKITGSHIEQKKKGREQENNVHTCEEHSCLEVAMTLAMI